MSISSKERARESAANDEHFNTDHLLANFRARTVSSGLVRAGAQGVQFVLNLVAMMVLARLLTPNDFGLIAMVTVVLSFLRIFKDASLSTATVQREGITHAQVSNLFWINIAVSGLTSIIVASLAPVISWFYHEPRLVGIIWALSATFLVSGITVQHMALLNRQMRFKLIALIEIASVTGAVLVGVGMAWWKRDYWSLVGAQLALPLLTCILTWLACSWRPQLPTRRSGTRPLLNFGVDLSISTFLYSLARGADGILLGRFCGSDAVGLYSRASALLIRPMDQVISPLNAVFLPALSRLQTHSDRYKRSFLQVYEAVALGCFCVTGLLLPLSRPLTLVVLGDKWEKAAVIFAGFTIAVLFYPFCAVASWLFTSQGRGRDLLLASSIMSLLTVGSFVAGLPLGPAGVATVYSISGVLLVLPIYYYLAGRSGSVSTSDLWSGFLRHLPVGILVLGATWLGCKLVMDSAPLVQVLTGTLIGLLAGGVCVWVYPPARGVATGMFEALREWRNSRQTVPS